MVGNQDYHQAIFTGVKNDAPADRRRSKVNDTLQFPLPLLAYKENHHDRCEAIITYATIATGMHRLGVLSPPQIEQELDGENLPKRNREVSDEQIRIIALGCKWCGICRPETASQAVWRWERYQAVENFLHSWKAAGRTIPWTRVRKDMVFEARDGTEKTYHRFAALCAVNAAIGSKLFAVVTRNRIRAGMLGYASGKLLFGDGGNLTAEGRTLLESRADQQRQPISTSQARTLLDNFVKTRLLNRFTPYRGSFTYYSKNNPEDPANMTAEKIGAALLARAQRTSQNPKLQILGEQIRQAKQGKPLLSGDVLLSGDFSEASPHNTSSPHNGEASTQSPPDHHLIATQSPLNAALNAALNATENAPLNAERILPFSEPTLRDVEHHMEGKIADPVMYARIWLGVMKKRGWRDTNGIPLNDWKTYADECCKPQCTK
ncbi:MAG: hypothetical protein P4L87_21990 [Formivibrio sp.]|nr:hypothetical protein [Formivibrio sp.]